MKTYPLKTIIAQAKLLSPFYRKLYLNLPDDGNWKLEDIPLTDQKLYWQHNTVENNQLLTGEMTDGIVYKSGGTTGNPKFSVYSKMEWETMTGMFGLYFGKDQIVKGDRVANLFYVGELYSSFIFLNDSLERCMTDVLLFPVSGAAPVEMIVHTIRDFNINVLLGVPTTILNLADFVVANNIEDFNIEKIYFGGESMYPDQREKLTKIFPGVKILSVGYASVDGGLLGYVDESCGFNEHRVFGDYNIIEIIDEVTGEPIHESGKEGKIYSTNLSRILMPIIRYPVGDNGIWMEPEGTADRKYKILGRSEEGARIGPITFYVEDLLNVIKKFDGRIPITNAQMIIDHFDNKDRLTIRFAVAKVNPELEVFNEEIVGLILYERHMIAEEIAKSKIHPIKVEWIPSSELEINKRTGKLKRIIDKRF